MLSDIYRIKRKMVLPEQQTATSRLQDVPIVTDAVAVVVVVGSLILTMT